MIVVQVLDFGILIEIYRKIYVRGDYAGYGYIRYTHY
jgi:hypothetical protein